MNLKETRHAIAAKLADQLKRLDLKVVFAESCTSGLVAATLGSVAGISQHLCGSAVTYRAATKSAWLNIALSEIEEFTAESKQVTDLMATNVLSKTPEANISAAITGHFGPGAPLQKDGVVFVSIAERLTNGIQIVLADESKLKSVSRNDRQEEAVVKVLELVLKTIQARNRG